MVLIFLKNGECIEYSEGAAASRTDEGVAVTDRHGRRLAWFPAANVETYSADPQTVDLIEEEVCEDVTRIPGDADPSR